MSIHLVSMVWKTELGSPAVKAVAMKLADCANDEGESIWPSVATIARETEISERTVQAALRKLLDMGLIKLVEAGGNGPGSVNVYEIDLMVLAQMKMATQKKWSEADSKKKGAKSAPFRKLDKGANSADKGANSADKGARVADKPSLTIIEPSITIAHEPPKKVKADQFGTFWQAYPLKKGKAKAREKFLSLSAQDAEAAVRGAAAYAAECIAAKREPRYVKWAEGWLTARRFEDYEPTRVEDLQGPEGQRWGWWAGKEAKLRALSVDHWNRAINELRPNGTWPWWKLGPPPGHADCLVPESIVRERGFAEKYQGRVTHG